MTYEAESLHIASNAWSADIATTGAELQNLSDADGRLLQWTGDPAVWAGRAPILFPVIGLLHDGRYRLDDRRYAMPKHGFARHARFDVLSHDVDAAVLRLAASDETRAAYPFEFTLDVAFTMRGARLDVVATVSNHDAAPMPASFGFHPAFAWPLPYGRPRTEHDIRFAHDEPGPIRRIDADGFLRLEPQPTPVVGDRLVLRDKLFDDDAVIFDRLTSRRVRYGVADGPRIEVAFDGFPTLGVWTKPGGAHFICIEPWQGFTDPVGFDGDIRDKPGIVSIPPGDRRVFTMTLRLLDGADGVEA